MRRGKTIRNSFLLLLILALLAGCAGNVEEKPKNLTIESPIEGYTPAMSSVIGLPLTVRWEELENIPKDIEYHWKAEEGSFLLWSSGTGIVERLEEPAVVQSDSIYWWPDMSGLQGDYIIDLQVEAKAAGKDETIATGSVKIDCKNGFYSISFE